MLRSEGPADIFLVNLEASVGLVKVLKSAVNSGEWREAARFL